MTTSYFTITDEITGTTVPRVASHNIAETLHPWFAEMTAADAPEAREVAQAIQDLEAAISARRPSEGLEAYLAVTVRPTS